jgi:hypothetical protein
MTKHTDPILMAATQLAVEFVSTCRHSRRLSMDQEILVQRLHLLGWPYGEIARKVGLVSKNSVRFRVDAAFRDRHRKAVYAYARAHRDNVLRR